MKIALFVLTGIVLVWLAALWWKYQQQIRHRKRFERAQSEFSKQSALTEKFLAAANATGKPRGLRWVGCELHGTPLFAVDRASQELLALSGATISFEALPGGDMEEVEAVGDIRYVTVIFIYRNDSWTSDGRAIFNLEPAEALARLTS